MISTLKKRQECVSFFLLIFSANSFSQNLLINSVAETGNIEGWIDPYEALNNCLLKTIWSGDEVVSSEFSIVPTNSSSGNQTIKDFDYDLNDSIIFKVKEQPDPKEQNWQLNLIIKFQQFLIFNLTKFI